MGRRRVPAMKRGRRTRTRIRGGVNERGLDDDHDHDHDDFDVERDRWNGEKERERKRSIERENILLLSSLGAPMQYARDPGFDNKGSLMQARQVCVYANEGEGR